MGSTASLADPAPVAMIEPEQGIKRMRAARIKHIALLGAAVATVALGGCTTDVGPSAAELKSKWDAENIFPQAYRQDLLAYLRTYLNDPSHVRGAAVSQPQLKYIGPGDRYVACVRFNARNNDGKYQGSKDGAAVYVAGKLDRFFDIPKDVRELCKDAVYAPFPELERLTR
jgi:hypothetical protein